MNKSLYFTFKKTCQRNPKETVYMKTIQTKETKYPNDQKLDKREPVNIKKISNTHGICNNIMARSSRDIKDAHNK
jgi:hypothetical protein